MSLLFDYSNALQKTTRHLREALRSLHAFLDRKALRLKRKRLRSVPDPTRSYLDAALTEPSRVSRPRKPGNEMSSAGEIRLGLLRYPII